MSRSEEEVLDAKLRLALANRDAAPIGSFPLDEPGALHDSVAVPCQQPVTERDLAAAVDEFDARAPWGAAERWWLGPGDGESWRFDHAA